MGTRHLIAVQKDGEYKVAQYGQWDGYPSGQGLSVLNNINSQAKRKRLINGLEKVRFLDPKGEDKEFLELYEKNTPTWSSEPDNRTEEQKHWFSTYISRDLGADILYNISHSKDNEIILDNSLSFAGESLFCEFAYVIDFDKETLEVFEGFNKEPILNGRFTSEEIKKGS